MEIYMSLLGLRNIPIFLYRPSHGVTFGKPEIDLDKIRDYKDSVVGKLTTGLGGIKNGLKGTGLIAVD